MTHISDRDVPDLCEFLDSHPEIKTLSLASCGLNNNVAIQLGKNKTIVVLNLSGNKINETGLNYLAQMEKLKEFIMQYSHLNDTFIAKFVVAFSNHQNIQRINFSCNDISDEGAVKLADFCRNLPVFYLNLTGNYIAERGGRALANLVKTNPNWKVEILPQVGGALPNATVLTQQQWVILMGPVDEDPLVQANKERKVGLNADVPSLKDMAIFCVLKAPDLAIQIDSKLPTDLKDEVIAKKPKK